MMMTNQKQFPQNNLSYYETTELKLAALLLAEIPHSAFEIHSLQGNTYKKSIKILFSGQYQADVNQLISEFINRTARVAVFLYNKNLNLIRDKIRDDGK